MLMLTHFKCLLFMADIILGWKDSYTHIPDNSAHIFCLLSENLDSIDSYLVVTVS